MILLKNLLPALFIGLLLATGCKIKSGNLQPEPQANSEAPLQTVSHQPTLNTAADSCTTGWALPPKPATIQFTATDNRSRIPVSTYQLTVTD